MTTQPRKLFRAEIEARLDEVLFASPSHRSAGDLAAGLEGLSRPQQDLVLHWSAVATQTYAEIGYLVAALAPRALQVLDADGFVAWTLAGLDAYDRQGGRGAMDRLRGLDAFVAEYRGLSAAAAFAEVEPRLARFLQGLSGRPLGLRVGEVAWTDTETVFLPAALDLLSSPSANRELYKATAVLLWAQTRYGSFGSADIDLAAALARWPQREPALGWLAALEAVRLEARIAAELPGLAAAIAAIRGPWPPPLAALAPRLADGEATLADTLALVDECLTTGSAPPALPHVGRFDPEAALRVRAERIGREIHVLRRALSVLKGAGGRGPGDEAAAPLNAEGGPVEMNIEADLLALPPEGRAAAQSLIQDLGQLPPEALVPAGPGLYRPEERPHGDGSSMLPAPCDYRYDEWDYRRRAYRQGWCHLYELEVAPGEAGYVEAVRRRHAGLIGQIRRRFEALRGEDRILGRQPDGEEIDVDAQVEALSDRRSGVEPSPRLFCRRIRHERSLAAMFMVDMSGSTKGWINDAEREALVMLCEALETLGDAYAIYGFSGWTRTRCDIYRIKDFSDGYDEAVRRRIAAIEAKDYTRMGVAVRHLTALLLRQPARHRLLVTLSDGRPDDFGDEYRGHYGIEDTRRALQEAHAQGVRGYCVTIDRHGADYLARLYGPAGYTVLDDVKKLPLKVAEIYRRLTT